MRRTVGGDGERNGAQADGRAWGRDRGLVVDVALAGLGKARGDSAFKVGDDFGRGVAVEGRVC